MACSDTDRIPAAAYLAVRADAGRLPLPDRSCDLVIGSPPYLECRDYGIAAGRRLDAWIDWMLGVTREALRVSKGLVLWVCAGDGGLRYRPGPEGLLYRAHREGIPTLRPDYWRANKPPTGTKRWFTNTMEYVLAFGEPSHFNPVPLATSVKYRGGGAFRMRGRSGARVGGSNYPTHGIRRTVPNCFYVPVGGGRMGHALASENEAPFPVGVPHRFVVTCSPPGGLVLDPFGGGGTTAQAALQAGRRCVTADLRMNQCELAMRRLATVTPGFAFLD